MAWQTQEYYQSQKKTLRPGTYLRLHENKWASAEQIFITGEMWDPCVDREHRLSVFTGDRPGLSRLGVRGQLDLFRRTGCPFYLGYSSELSAREMSLTLRSDAKGWRIFEPYCQA